MSLTEGGCVTDGGWICYYRCVCVVDVSLTEGGYVCDEGWICY